MRAPLASPINPRHGAAMQTGPRNLITDVPGLLVGQASHPEIRTGVTVLTARYPITAGVAIMGGAPGTRDTDLLAPDKTVDKVHALVLSGGSAYGLDAASGVMAALAEKGQGFAVAGHLVPIVPTAILFDLNGGGPEVWPENPYPALGRAALENADAGFELGSHGAGTGATTADLMGGIGSASLKVGEATVGALVAVNALGSAVVGGGPHFWAGPFEMEGEFGGLGPAVSRQTDWPPTKLGPGTATTIAIVATDAKLDKAGCTRLATAAHDGMARALMPSHTPMDGDLVFAASYGEHPADPLLMGHAAATCLSRAIARGVYTARSGPGCPLPSWSEKFS